MLEKVYTNYRLLLPNQEILGTLVTKDGYITDIQSGIVSQGKNGNGDYLMPGLIELHTDHLERCMMPRSNVRWPLYSAVINHDRDLISSGITTVCDAISIGDFKPTDTHLTPFKDMIEGITEGQNAGRLKAEHRLHLRCELSYPLLEETTEGYCDHPLLSLISLMDHTPGQRQFWDVKKYSNHYITRHGIPAKDMEHFIQTRQENQQKYALKNRQGIVDLAHRHNIPLASHDDSTVEQVEESIQDQVILAEFPTTLEAAKLAHTSGLKILMGAPNLVLGGSHSGNISALDLVEHQWVDILSSDYAPRSLLESVFIITKETNQPLYEVLKLITLNPAKLINIAEERGCLKVGQKADFITVHYDKVVPQITAVFCQGERVA